MFFKITRATDNAETTEETREAESRQQIEQEMAEENPGFEWSSSDVEDHLIGKKYRADGSGTEQIIIVKPIIIAVVIAVIWWFLK